MLVGSGKAKMYPVTLNSKKMAKIGGNHGIAYKMAKILETILIPAVCSASICLPRFIIAAIKDKSATLHPFEIIGFISGFIYFYDFLRPVKPISEKRIYWQLARNCVMIFLWLIVIYAPTTLILTYMENHYADISVYTVETIRFGIISTVFIIVVYPLSCALYQPILFYLSARGSEENVFKYTAVEKLIFFFVGFNLVFGSIIFLKPTQVTLCLQCYIWMFSFFKICHSSRAERRHILKYVKLPYSWIEILTIIPPMAFFAYALFTMTPAISAIRFLEALQNIWEHGITLKIRTEGLGEFIAVNSIISLSTMQHSIFNERTEAMLLRKKKKLLLPRTDGAVSITIPEKN